MHLYLTAISVDYIAVKVVFHHVNHLVDGRLLQLFSAESIVEMYIISLSIIIAKSSDFTSKIAVNFNNYVVIMAECRERFPIVHTLLIQSSLFAYAAYDRQHHLQVLRRQILGTVKK